ncbi:MAG: cyclic nucleotide-binding domain-containing protein [Clostridium sp.]|uniref:cyclic nucleotide-binding domain-containing protein n=1 Tax=Clostridium sp. TaxID=1506 RepID=UPI0029070FA7|nr:cyclic nucleotide-binding domain-containing protein [Clostridium sp.]MDU7338805.1 cyclic nucleotide-binding domain-containing protein [Clostridium sp.]
MTNVIKGGIPIKYLALSQNQDLLERINRVRSSLSAQAFECFRLCRYDTGELLYKEGRQAGSLQIMLAGSCKVFKTLENGRNVLLCIYEDIEVMGEFELFGDPLAKTNVQALKETYCLSALVQEHRERLLSDNSFLQFVCRETCAKTDRNSSTIAINLLYPLEQRLAGYILVMQKNGVFSANYTLLAESLGCSLRHLLRVFRSLCDKGLLQKTKAGYRIADSDSLSKIAGNVYRQ